MAQKRKAQAGSNVKSFYYILGAVAVIGIGVLAWIVLRTQSARAALDPVEVEGAQDPQALVAKAQGVALGSDTAPVKMLVFSDFQCPFCGTFAAQMEPLIKRDFVDTGVMQFVYYDFPLGGTHRYSFVASRATRCAGDQNKFWEYHNLLFRKQSDWSSSSKPPIGKLIDYSSEVGLDRATFESCVNSDKYQDIVSANRLLGERLGVNSTPTVFVNTKRLPAEVAMDIKALRELVNAELATRQVPAATTGE